MVSIHAWFFDIHHQMDLVDLKRYSSRQIEALKPQTVADDLRETSILPPLPHTLLTRWDL